MPYEHEGDDGGGDEGVDVEMIVETETLAEREAVG